MYESKNNVVIVTNRAPLSDIFKGTSKLTIGGLVSAMHRVASSRQTKWVFTYEGLIPENYKSPKEVGYILEPVMVNKKEYKSYYEGYSNALIWPLFHYFPGKCAFSDEDWLNYKHVNNQIAKKIFSGIEGSLESTIWIHDYHLLLTASYLRALGSHNRIGFFLHIPFPTYEVFRLLPQREAVLKALLANDLIGFHTKSYVINFFRSVRNFVKDAQVIEEKNKIIYQGRTIRVKDFPISVDAETIKNQINKNSTKNNDTVLNILQKDLKIGLGVDRLDYTKGIYERLRAIEFFLRKNPKYRNKVTFIQIAVPSRGEVPDYQSYKFQCEQLISKINGQFGNLHWQPIIYINRSIPFEQLLHYYKIADFALITPLRDGMNLVAKEFVLARKPNAVLILSELTGAAEELSNVAMVNPYNQEQIAYTIKYCLEHPGYQNSILNEYDEYISKNHVYNWADNFLNDLESQSLL